MIVMIMHQAADQLSKCHHHSMWGCNHLTFKLSTTFLQNLAYTLQQAFSASNFAIAKVETIPLQKLTSSCVWYVYGYSEWYKIIKSCLLCPVQNEVLQQTKLAQVLFRLSSQNAWVSHKRLLQCKSRWILASSQTARQILQYFLLLACNLLIDNMT